MSGTGGYTVNYPALDGIRQSLEDCHISLTSTVEQTGPGRTVLSDTYHWSTSAANSYASLVTDGNLGGHANDIAGYAAHVHTSIVGYATSEVAAQSDVASVAGGL
jgi:hypothetical protein